VSAARHAGVKERQRDPEDERQVRVSLTKGGRPLRERGLKMDLVEATGVAAGRFRESAEGDRDAAQQSHRVSVLSNGGGPPSSLSLT
jgi:DNA-binding MarR family transcriptional regulator